MADNLNRLRKVLSRPVSVLVAACVALACLLVGIFATMPIAYTRGTRSAAVSKVAEETAKADAEYQKYKRLAKEQKEDYEAASQTIARADNIQNGIEDLKSKHDDLQKQVDDAKQQLETLTGQVEQARRNSVSSGVWQVGKDIDAGTYRANDSVTDRCYWEVSVGDDIVQNDMPGGGYPQVTVSDGQQLKLQNCGTFTKQ
ncbi:hypothetical protein MCC02031_18140 [Bifidobacteriaceae bacterium MCC02031]|nr:MAG: hypothetical protein AYW82_01270 [Bifidobacterium dentium]GDZ35115.1 hypothetical protein MCC02031_18140 [Bifidobacteriaceae bacterium MCC02031]